MDMHDCNWSHLTSYIYTVCTQLTHSRQNATQHSYQLETTLVHMSGLVTVTANITMLLTNCNMIYQSISYNFTCNSTLYNKNFMDSKTILNFKNNNFKNTLPNNVPFSLIFFVKTRVSIPSH